MGLKLVDGGGWKKRITKTIEYSKMSLGCTFEINNL